MSAKKHFVWGNPLFAVLTAVKKEFTDDKGRVARLQYWVRIPIYYAIYYLSVHTDLVFINDDKLWALAWGVDFWLIFFLMWISVIIFSLSGFMFLMRRCNDIGISNEYAFVMPFLLKFLPPVGIASFVIMGCLKSDAARDRKTQSTLFSLLPFSKKHRSKKKRKRKR